MSDDRLCVCCAVYRPADESTLPDEPPVCGSCRKRVRGELSEIPDLYALIATMNDVEPDFVGLKQWPDGRMRPHNDPIGGSVTSGPVRGANTGPQVRGKPAPSLPGNPDHWDLTAPARPGSIGIRERNMWEGSGADPDQIGYLAVATELNFWVGEWREAREMREAIPSPNISTMVGWLLNRLDWALDHYPAIDECAAAIHRIVRTLRGVTQSHHAREAAGTCPAQLRDDSRCNASLSVDPYIDLISCPKCGSQWHRKEAGWMKLRAQQDGWNEEAA